MVSATYRDAPFVEAVFEFAPTESTFTNDSLDHLVQKLEPGYTGRRDIQKTFAFGIEYSAGLVKPLRPPAPIDRHRRWNSDESRLVQYSADLCVFNALPAYTHFVDYLPAIEVLHRAYVEACRPKGTKFLGQRYINKIVLPSLDASPEEYFSFYPPKLPQTRHPGFSLTIVTKDLIGDGSGSVTLRLLFQGEEQEKPVYFLEIYARTVDHPPYPFTWDAALQWHKKAHEGIEEAFETALTSKCKSMLGLQPQ